MKRAYYLTLSLLLPLANTTVLQATEQRTSSAKLRTLTIVATLCLANSFPKGLSHKKSNLCFATIEPFQKDNQQYVHLVQIIDNQNICQSQLSLFFEKSWNIEKLACIPFNRQHHYIHIIADHTNRPICYIGSIGLKGGGNGSSTTTSNDADYDSYSALSTPIKTSFTNLSSNNNFDKTFHDINFSDDESYDNTIGNYLEKTDPSSCLAKDGSRKDDRRMNTNSHQTPSPKSELSLPKVNDFWFDHTKKNLTPPSFTFTNQPTISKQKILSFSFTPKRPYASTINRKMLLNKKKFCDRRSGHPIHNTNVPSLLNPSKEKKSSNDALSSCRNDNNTHNLCRKPKPNIPSLHDLFLHHKPNEGQELSQRFANTIRITNFSNRKPKPEKTSPKQRFYDELQGRHCKRVDDADELDDFVSEYLQREDKQKRNNQKLCKLATRRNKPEEFVSRTKRVLQKVTADNKRNKSYDLSKENLLLTDEYKLGNSSKHFDIPLLDLKKVGGGRMFSSEQYADKEKKERLRKTGELIGMDCLL